MKLGRHVIITQSLQFTLGLTLTAVHSMDLGKFIMITGFPSGSAGKQSACNAGDEDSIPGSERSPGEETGYPLQYSWASWCHRR